MPTVRNGALSLFVATVAAVGVLPATGVAASHRSTGHGAPAGNWHGAVVAPGTAALNLGGDASVDNVSCPSAGNCSAGGYYNDKSGNYQAFVANQVNGIWRPAVAVPGSVAKNAGGDAETYFTSCWSPGNCGAGGYYQDASGHYQAFVVNSVNGVWHAAVEAPGTASLNVGGNSVAPSAAIEWGSCRSPGNCSAGGSYVDSLGHRQVFVINEINGAWHHAFEIPGTGALNVGGSASLYAISCGAANDCSAAGTYKDASGILQAFVANEVNKNWHAAAEVPGTAALNTGGTSGQSGAGLFAVSCWAPFSCSAVGQYQDTPSTSQAFVVDEVNGTWQPAVEAPGSGALNLGGDAVLSTISCPSSGNCVAGGHLKDLAGNQQALLANKVNGTWHAAVQPGTVGLNAGDDAQVDAASCWKAGACVAVGHYKDALAKFQAFVASETAGVWRAATKGPGSAGLNAGGDADLYSVSCTSVGSCAAGGFVKDGSGNWQAVLEGFLPPPPVVTSIAPAAGTHLGGTSLVVRGTNLSGVTSVLFGARQGTHVQVLNSGALRVRAPSGAGTVNVRVAGPGGTSAVTSHDRYRYV